VSFRTASFGGPGLPSSPPPPRDLVALLAVVATTFTFQFFATTAGLVALLRLTPAVWESGFLWQAVTYPFAGAGAPSVWFLLSLFLLFFFARDVRRALGARRFWTLLVGGAAAGAAVAIATRFALGDVAGPLPGPLFAGMQGQWMLSAITLAAFAVLFRERTILLFFVLPIRAGWFLPLELALAFLAFLADRDFAAFAGICGGVATAWWLVRTGPRLTLRELRLRTEQRWLEWRMARLRKKSGLRVVRGGRTGIDRNIN